MAMRLLISDDEALIALSFADMLKAAGFDVALAFDGTEALAVARRLGDALGVLVTDLDMPHLTGGDLIRALRADWPGLPVVVVTGSDPPGGAGALQCYCGGHGSLALLHKPLANGALIKAVQQALAAHS
jgi:CheY-like chemotaxis protein